MHRGLAYWERAGEKRIVYGTGDAYLIALDAEMGTPVPDFGEDGRIDLTQGLRRPIDRLHHGVSSPPVICRDKVVVGATIVDIPLGKEMPPSDVRTFEVGSGELALTFESIPQGEIPGGETWGDLSWQRFGNTNVWSYMSCDEEMGLVYQPLSTPSNDYYGGERPGDNLYAEAIVALDIESGRRVWHFQAIHHGIWNYDLPAAPNLVDISVNGRKVRALAQVSKQGFVCVLNRETGEPVWPIEERPVPQQPTVPGEQLSATRPSHQAGVVRSPGIGPDDLIDFTPELKGQALAILERFDYGPLFTPFTERGPSRYPV